MRRATITSVLLLIACVSALVALPLDFPGQGKALTRPKRFLSMPPGRWVVDGGIVAEHSEKKTGENRIIYISEDGVVKFSHSVDDFSVVKFVSNREYLYGILYRQAESEWPRGYYKIIKCGRNGDCHYDNLFVEGVFDIAADEKGYYAITYRFEDFHFADLFSRPVKAEIFHVSDFAMSKVCCQADIMPYSVTYSPAMGVTLSATVASEDETPKFSILRLSNGKTSKLFEESLEPPTTIWDRKIFDPFFYCARHHIADHNFICIYPHIVFPQGEIYEMHVLDSSFHPIGHLTSLAFPKLIEGRGVVYMTEDEKLATLDVAKLAP